MGKAQRIRKQHREERKVAEDAQAMFDRLQAFVEDVDIQDNGPYFACSLDTEHSEDCVSADEELRTFTRQGQVFPCFEMTKWDVAIAHEQKLWELVNMDPGNVQQNLFGMDVTLQTLVDTLVEDLGVNRDALNERFQIKMYVTLKTIRERFAPEVMNARRQEMIARVIPGGILGPNGKVIGHD